MGEGYFPGVEEGQVGSGTVALKDQPGAGATSMLRTQILRPQLGPSQPEALEMGRSSAQAPTGCAQDVVHAQEEFDS